VVIERRAFISALGLSALAPLAVAAQQAQRVPRVSYLLSPSSEAAGYIAFRHGLRELGYVEGRDITFEDRFAEGRSCARREI
jgi:putative ABC transport system substrate-binding protein